MEYGILFLSLFLSLSSLAVSLVLLLRVSSHSEIDRLLKEVRRRRLSERVKP